MNHISYDCTECDSNVTTEYGNETKDDDGNLICEDCDTTPFDDLDFPIWFSYELQDDNHGLLDEFCWATGLEYEDIPGYVDSMKVIIISLHFKMEGDGTLSGPYDERRGELI